MDAVSVKVVPSTLCGTLTGQHSEQHLVELLKKNGFICNQWAHHLYSSVILTVKDQSQPGAKLIFNHASGSAKWRVRVSQDHLGYYLEETEGKMFDLYFIRRKSASKSALKIHSESQQLPQIILLHLNSWLIIRMHHFFFVMMTNSMSAIWKEGHLLFRANCKVRTCFRFFVLLCVG